MTVKPTFWGRASAFPALGAGLLLSGAGICFNVSYGYHWGGSDPLRAYGMAVVFLGCILLKDSLLGKMTVAWKQKRYGLALACILGIAVGAAGSFIAAFGSASEGRDEKSDPRAREISAYDTAAKTEAEAETRLKELGRVATVAEVEAKAAAALTRVDRGIARRTKGCTDLAPDGSGPKQQSANAEACQPVSDLAIEMARAKDAEKARKQRDLARETLSKGKPKAADPMVASLASLKEKIFGKDASGEITVAGLLTAVVALIVEIGAPIAWMVWQLSGAPSGNSEKSAEPLGTRPANDPGIPGNAPAPNPPRGGRRGRKADPIIVQFSDRFREKHGRSPSGSEIRAQFPELPVSTAYDYAGRSRNRA